jgi:hypothetical protein
VRTGAAVDSVEPRIRELLAEFPTMAAPVIADRIGGEPGDDDPARPGSRAASIEASVRGTGDNRSQRDAELGPCSLKVRIVVPDLDAVLA